MAHPVPGTGRFSPTASKDDAFLFKSSGGLMEQLNDCLQLGCLCRSAVQADVRKRMSPSNRQDVPQISKELGIHRSTLYQWRSNWRLQGEAHDLAAYEEKLNAISSSIHRNFHKWMGAKPCEPKDFVVYFLE